MTNINHPDRIKARLKARPTQAAIITKLCANASACNSDPREFAEDDARAAWPKPGDFIVVSCALGPSETLAGWLISASTTKPEFHTRWVLEDLSGVVREWYNVRVRGVPLGNPYALEQDERWAHPNLGELPLIDGRKVGTSMTSYDADGKVTGCAAIVPTT